MLCFCTETNTVDKFKRMRMNKKAQGLSVTTIVIIVLALVVLVVLVLGFTGGWGNLWGRMGGFFGGGSNVDSIVQACQVSCATQSKYDYCTRERPIRADTAVFKVKKDNNKPTDEIVAKDADDPADAKKGKASCKELADWYSDLGFEKCPDLCG